jgi:hypothetical protein
MEMLTKLKDQFGKRYGQQLADLNKNVYISAKNDKGSFEIPVVTLGKGGGTVIDVDSDAVTLNAPAMVSLTFKNMKPYRLVYRVAVPASECQIAANKPEYFNYLFDAVMTSAIGNYKATVGGHDKVRFGTKYIDASLTQPNDEYVEIRFTGEWAGDTEDLT